MNYQQYLNSSQWKRIRRRVLKRDKHKCLSCGKKAYAVHHNSYDKATMEGRCLDRLYSLCNKCHESVSLDIFGFKRPMKEQTTWTLFTGKPPRKSKHKQPKKPKPRGIEAIRKVAKEYAYGGRK